MKTGVHVCEVENNFVGLRCGIMDQFVIANGKKDNAVFLDTATLEYKYAPIKLENAKEIFKKCNDLFNFLAE